MIKLEVQDYCQSCPRFEPDVERPVHLYKDADPEPYVSLGDTTIRCEYRRICRMVKHKRGSVTMTSPLLFTLQNLDTTL